MSSVHGGKNVVSFVHPGKNSLVSFGSGVFCPTFLEISQIYIYLKYNTTYEVKNNGANHLVLFVRK